MPISLFSIANPRFSVFFLKKMGGRRASGEDEHVSAGRSAPTRVGWNPRMNLFGRVQKESPPQVFRRRAQREME